MQVLKRKPKERNSFLIFFSSLQFFFALLKCGVWALTDTRGHTIEEKILWLWSCNFCNQRLFFFLFVTSPKKKSPKKLFCFSAPTNDDHATSAFYLLTQQRITKLQFLKSSKISKCYFSFFLSHFCTLHSSKTSLIVWTFFFV